MTLAHTLFAVALLGSVACDPDAQARSKPAATPGDAEQSRARVEITSMMQASARAWTNGDLDAFMDSYEPSKSITYVTPSGVVHGRDSIQARYAPRFAPGAKHDSLSFEDMEIDLMAPEVANVIAYYRLSRGDSTTARGPTTVVMRKRDGKWRIIHDHSS